MKAKIIMPDGKMWTIQVEPLPDGKPPVLTRWCDRNYLHRGTEVPSGIPVYQRAPKLNAKREYFQRDSNVADLWRHIAAKREEGRG